MGDAACHLDSVCLSCGRFVEVAEPGGRCPHCDDPTDGSLRPGPVFRRAAPAEAAAVGELTERSYRSDGHLDRSDGDWYAAQLRDAAGRIADAVVLVAAIDDEIVATVTLAGHGTPYAETARPGELEVRMLAVAPEARQRGLGESMMVEARRHAVAMGFSRIVLCTEPDVGAAHRLYRRLGYRRQPERDWSVGGYDLMSYGCEVDPMEERP